MQKTYRLVFADKKGRIFGHPDIAAAGMEAGNFYRLGGDDLIRLPGASCLYMLPSRRPVGYDNSAGRFATPSKDLFAVAASLAPGYTATYSAAYEEKGCRLRQLPLFSYAAAAFYKGEFYASAVRVDRTFRHDPRFVDMKRVCRNAAAFRKIFPKNRLIAHLSDCALKYACVGAQNFFLKRYEGPLPTSPLCNARCLGCISYQPKNRCRAAQPRIKFAPRPEEVSQIAVFHIENVGNAVVSFGQGCEGEPLLAGDLIERSIRLIRHATRRGTINMNTNASRPELLRRLFDAGLDSIRVSINSARSDCYTRYYKPIGYTFRDVVRSIRIAKEKDKFVSINYLTMPGFTDSRDEFTAFRSFVEKNGVDMIQWRNLNIDPLFYFRQLKLKTPPDMLIGVRNAIDSLRKEFPRLRMGCYNPAEI